jgi:hypothetical protein
MLLRGQNKVESYLRSAGFNLINSDTGFIVADKPEVGGDRDTLLVWLPHHLYPGRAFSQIEASLIDRIDHQITRYPDARCIILVESLEGISKTFRSITSSRNVKIRVPVQFFDAAFRVEASPEATSSVIKSLRDISDIGRPIPQPFSEAQGDVRHTGPDLFTHLQRELTSAVGPCIRFVVGSAGVGKSILFRRLFYVLYRDFLDSKNHLRMSARPIPLVPEHLRETYTIRTLALVDSFPRSDVAAPVSRETLEWMLTNRCCIWMFDGLDELYSGDPEFFDYVLDLLTRQDSNAQILVCARDSLLSSNDRFVQFLRSFSPAEPAVRVYRLTDWDVTAKREFASVRLAGSTSGEGIPSTVANFINVVNSNASIRQLSGLPYYCSLLVERFKDGQSLSVTDQFELLGEVVSAMQARELAKGTILPDAFEAEGLDDFLETIAADYCLNNYSGTAIDDVQGYSEIVLRHCLSDEDRQKLVTSLVQYPLFVDANRPGFVSFKHELLAEYLFGRQLAKMVKGGPLSAVRKLVGRPLLKDTLSFEYLVKETSSDNFLRQMIAKEILINSAPDRAFRVLLQLWLSSRVEREPMPNHGFLASRDLTGITFQNMDLSNVSFRNCNLTDASFIQCNLTEARFEGAHLVGTVFNQLDINGLRGAQFGNFQHFEYVYVGTRRIEEREEFRKWASQQTGIIEDRPDPCPTVLQIRGVLSKYVRADGSGRRGELPVRALISGRVYAGAPTIDDCISCCIKHQFLNAPNYRGRVRRANGDRYDEIVSHMKDWTIGAGLTAVLDELCPIRGCCHIP